MVPSTGFYTTDAKADYALEFRMRAKGTKPFLLYMAYNRPHYPCMSKKDFRKYEGDKALGGTRSGQGFSDKNARDYACRNELSPMNEVAARLTPQERTGI